MFAPALDGGSEALPHLSWDDKPNDAFVFSTVIHHYGQVIRGEAPVTTVDRVCAPAGLGWGNINTAPAFTVPAAAAMLATGAGPVLMMNLMTGIATALFMLAVFLYLRSIVDDPPAALLAAPLAVLTPYHVNAVSHGHVKLIGLFWLPLLLLMIERMVDRPTLRRGAVLGGVAAMTFYTSPQMTAYLSVAAPLYGGLRMFQEVGTDISAASRFLRPAAVSVAVFLGMALPYYAMFRTAEASVPVERIIAETPMLRDASLLVLVFGLSLSLLDRSDARRLVPLYATGVAAALLAAGPHIRPSPYLVFYHVIPYFTAFKSPEVFLYLTWMAVAALAAHAISRLRTAESVPVMVAAAVVVLAAFQYTVPPMLEYRAVMTTQPVDDTPLYAELADRPGTFSVVEYPQVYYTPAVYGTTVHGGSTMNCPATFPPREVERFQDICGRGYYTPTANCTALADEHDLRYIVFHADLYQERWIDVPPDCTAWMTETAASVLGYEDRSYASCCTADDRARCLFDRLVAGYVDHPDLVLVAEWDGTYLFRRRPGGHAYSR